ncbi:MAG: prepilin-type N-terminal cleavage/methylation domain-containing protein [Candidatus Omnitrophota bacterium]
MKRNAFTLVEVLIALAILAVVVASTLTIFKSVSKSWQRGETRSERYHNARTAAGKMAAEVSQAILSENGAAKFIGDKEGVRFISFISAQGGMFEPAEISYWLDRDRNLLMRNEDTDPDYDFSTYDASDVLGDAIYELEFSYYDGLSWNDEWDSSGAPGNALPKAVKIKIRVDDKKGKEGETFEIMSRLKTA